MLKRRRLAATVNWAMLIIAFIAIGIGYLRLDSNQTAIKDLGAERAHDNCVVQRESLKPLRDIILFTTQPADLTGLTGERLTVGQETNRRRAEAQTQLLKLIPELHC